MKTKITRRTKLGYGVNCNPTQGENGFYFEKPTGPYITGTYNTAMWEMQRDPFLNSLTNTYKSSGWFVRVNGTWMRVTDYREFDWAMNELYYKHDRGWGEEYEVDFVEVEVEYISPAAAAAAEMGKARSAKKAAASAENGKSGGRPKVKNA